MKGQLAQLVKLQRIALVLLLLGNSAARAVQVWPFWLRSDGGAAADGEQSPLH